MRNSEPNALLEKLAEDIIAGKVNYYEALGVTRAATDDQIKAAHKRKILSYHPDKNMSQPIAADIVSKHLNAGLAILLDPKERDKYNIEILQKSPQTAPLFNQQPNVSSELSRNPEEFDKVVKSEYGWVLERFLPRIRTMYLSGIVTDDDVNIFMTTTLFRTGPGIQFPASWHNFDNLKFNCDSSKWSQKVISYLQKYNRTGSELSFKNSDFSNAKLTYLKLDDDTSFDFSGAKFIGTDLRGTTLRGNLENAVFDRKSLSSGPEIISLRSDQQFYICHNEQLICVTPEKLLEGVKAVYKKSYFGGGKSIEEATKYGDTRSKIEVLIKIVLFMKTGSDLEKAWDKALDKMAHEQGLSLQIQDTNPLQIEAKPSTSFGLVSFFRPSSASTSESMIPDGRIARLKEIYESNVTGISLEKNKIFKVNATFDNIIAALEKNAEGKTSGASYNTLHNDEVMNLRKNSSPR